MRALKMLSALFFSSLAACGGSPSAQKVPVAEPLSEQPQPLRSIKDAYAPYFPIGAAVTPKHLATVGDILKTHFNHLTAENDMKMAPSHPGPNNWNFDNADAIAAFARETGMKMTGHTLVWHQMQPDWLFGDLTPKDPKSIALLKERLKTHIDKIVERYADIVDNWDVVNEAISDNPDKTFRDGAEGSKWYEIYGDESYIVDAFTFAAEALVRFGGAAEGKLYYNDYDVMKKADRIIALLTELRDEHHIPVTGVGFQAHWNLNWPPLSEIEEAFQKFQAAGFKVKISELDQSIYWNDDWGTQTWEKEKPFTPELEDKQAEKYRSEFELFRKYKDLITSVTLWGVSDDATWLDGFPAGPRNNYPLLFDDTHAPKKSAYAVVDF